MATVATTGAGVAETWRELERHRAARSSDRARSTRTPLRAGCSPSSTAWSAARLAERVGRIAAGARYDALGADVVGRRLDPWSAADLLLDEATDR